MLGKAQKKSGSMDAGCSVNMNTMTPSSPRLLTKGKPHSELGKDRHVVEKPGQQWVFFFFLVQRPNPSHSEHHEHEEGEPNKSLPVLCFLALLLLLTDALLSHGFMTAGY